MTGGSLDVLIHVAARMELATIFQGFADLYESMLLEVSIAQGG